MKKLAMIAALSIAGGLLTTTPAQAWSATYLQGQNWAITCANGQAFSYSGSSAGLDTVGPALCPGGIAGGGDVTATLDRLEAKGVETKASSSAGFPPHGYPCLGCEPCPGNPEEFCDIVWNVASPGLEPGQVVWSLKGMDPATREYMIKRYDLQSLYPERERPKPRQQRR